MPSKVGSLAIVGAGACGAGAALRAFVAPAAGGAATGHEGQRVRRLRRQQQQLQEPEQEAAAGASFSHGGALMLGAAAAAVGAAQAGKRAPRRGRVARTATATMEKKAFAKMPASVKPGVVTGKALVDLLNYAKENEFAMPGVNIVGTSSINACMEAAKKAGGPIMVTFSRGGGQFITGKAADNENDAACIAGCVAGALHVRTVAELYGVPVILHTDHCQKAWLPWFEGLLKANEDYYAKNGEPLFSSHMLDLSEEPLEENVAICKKYLERMAKVDLLLEMELGITGGEEDGVDNSDVDSSRLYTQPSEVWEVYEALSSVPNGNFTVAAAFGNVHGVYAPGNVELKPVILHNTQAYIKEKLGCESDKPVSFVFHGGSGSSKEDIQYAIKAGVIKMNIDTDTQWAFWDGVNEYQKKNKDYLQGQIGNPEGPEKPNKKYYDPRMSLRAGEVSMADRLVKAMQDLNCVDRL
uniref:fructose-bisphosphate aldolase n=1 Tax=Lingulaulax polyedra TaxID=160621 RepID=X2D9V1_LINPO|nr:class II fructose-1,6-bisphosphate aldolase [Lingulodinium polyedra]